MSFDEPQPEDSRQTQPGMPEPEEPWPYLHPVFGALKAASLMEEADPDRTAQLKAFALELDARLAALDRGGRVHPLAARARLAERAAAFRRGLA